MRHPLGDPDKRWQLEAVLRQALYDLAERGGHVSLVVSQLRRSLDAVEGD